jgi:hypothetical protein
MILEEGIERGIERGREEGREEGLLAGARLALFTVGTPRFGEPNSTVRQRIEAETDFARLQTWLAAVTRAESWTDLPGL